MVQMHKKNKRPIRPGRYWVLTEVRSKPSRNGTVTIKHADCGFANWDGTRWDNDEGWDVWYGEALPLNPVR